MKELRGKVAAITGAASGIGRATALRLAEEGCVQALIDLDEQRLAEVAAVRGFTESLWAELPDSNVGVTSIHPGGISTGITQTVRVKNEEARAQLQESFDKYGHPPDDVARGIIKGIRENRLCVRVGIESFFVAWLKRLMPVGFHRWVAPRMRVPGS